jgi:quercetin dioxygenase-like cupin family protein
MAEVAFFKDMIAFQKGAVVSREILRKPTGTVTLFAFSEGEGLSEHTTPYDAVVQALEGKAEIMIAGKTHLVSEGQFLIMPANSPHAVKALSPFKMLLTMIKS